MSEITPAVAPSTEHLDELARAVAHLKSGGVVAVATETFFGLCADARRGSAVDAVFALKGREETKASALLIPDLDAWVPLVTEVPTLAKRLATRFWPGPLTIALTAHESVHPLLKYRGKVAVRVPGPSPALELARAFGGPLTATSANPSGSPSSRSADDVRAYFEGRGGLLVLGGIAPGGMPSTVVEVVGDTWRMVRPGAVPSSVLEEHVAAA
jgi:L-threonylcarbamoyladenylate synthase